MKLATATARDGVDTLAATIALITHPVVVWPLSLLLVITSAVSSTAERWFYLLFLILLTSIPAALYLFVQFKGNIIEMLEVINREARLVPYLLFIVGAVAAAINLVRIQAPMPIFYMTAVLLVNEVILGTINFWTKVSVHTATATFSSLALGYLINPWWYLLLLLIPVIGWARVYRKRHTLNQVIGGAAFATINTVGTLVLLKYFT